MNNTKKPTIIVCVPCDASGEPSCQPFMGGVFPSLSAADRFIREHAGPGYVVKRALGRRWTQYIDGSPRYMWYRVVNITPEGC